MRFATFLQAIQTKKVAIGVIGLGYVGLPLALLLAKKGFHVTGFLRDQKKIDAINSGSYSGDSVDHRELHQVVQNGFLKAAPLTSVFLAEQDVFFICVPTPIDKKKKPDLNAIKDVARNLSKISLREKLVINESTVAPGTTRDVFGRLGATYLACSPERVDPGNKEKTVSTIAKVVGGIDSDSLAITKTLYASVLSAPIVSVSTLETAEMVKMLENTYRAVNIALVNEFARLSEKNGLDIVEIIEAARSKWSYHPHYPSLGVGGHCIPVDPWYLVEYGKQHKVSLPLIETGLEENEEMTAHVAKKLFSLYAKGMRVLLYGLTYKKDVKDIRESPVLRLAEMLRNKHITFAVYDPLFTRTEIANLGLQPGNLGVADIFIVGTDHSQLKNDYTKCISKHTIVVDGRNFFSQKVGKALYGVGRTLL